MRNLQLSVCSTVSDDRLKSVRQFCFDLETNNCFCLSGNTIYELTCGNQHSYSDCVTEYCFLENDGIEVIGLDYLPEQNAFCIITRDGNLILHSDDKFETIGSVESGFQAASWSPDGNILILITEHETIISMTREFEPIKETPLFSDDFGEGKFVTVGWGKKETQFHGSEGKAAAKHVDKNAASTLPTWDDGQPRVSWRGDGKLFAVNAISPKTGQRSIFVFSDDCILQYSSEVITGLEPPLSWRPNGSVIASVQRLPNKYQVIFLEKNGLRHGELVVSSTADKFIIRQISWNSDSSLLAIWLEDTEKRSCSKVQIWTMNNYHWYLKQTLDFSVDDCLTFFSWHPENALTLYCYTAKSRFICYSWEWVINRSMDESKIDDALVAVTDSNKVLLTPFRQMVVPPPLSAYNVVFPWQVNQICFPRNHSSGNFAVLLADNRIIIVSKDGGDDASVELKACAGNGFNVRVTPHRIAAIYDPKATDNEVDSVPLNFHNWLWLTPSIFICSKNVGGSSTIVQFRLDDSSRKIIREQSSVVKGLVRSITPTPNGSDAALQILDGTLLKYNINHPGSDCVLTKFPSYCHTMDSCSVQDQEMFFGLTDRLRLNCLDREISSNCVSFILHDDFLLIACNDHTLHSISLQSLLSQNYRKVQCESLRRLERGSRIITCIKNRTEVVLQMPRGNLEVIHPRSLTLSVVSKYLNELNFFGAFTLMRKQRINMNLLFDHDSANFLKNVDKFVSQINNVNWINLFLTDLQEENVTSSLYSTSYNNSSENRFLDKINIVHSAVRQALVAADSKKFLLCILTTYVMSNPPQLETALNLVKTLEKNEKDEALTYLQYLMDINELFNVALGTYDLDLVVMVAQKSQKDPKEYLPVLNELRKMELNYQRFNIDCKLQKYEKALEHVIKCGDERFDECLQHAITHKLYRRAIKLLPSNSCNYKRMAMAYAEHLSGLRKYEESGIWFERSNNISKAIEAFEKGLHWRKAIILARNVYSTEEFIKFASKLASYLREERRYVESAHVHEHYLSDDKESILTLIEGRQWQAALEMIHRCNYSEIIKTHLEGGLREHYRSLINSIKQKEVLLTQYTTRLQVVREEKKKKMLEGNDNVDDDLASEIASTITTTITTTTTRSFMSKQSSKNRRKQERKKQSLKKGNPFEESALVEACNEIFTEGDKMMEECSSMLMNLVSFGFDNESEELQTNYENFLILMKSKKDEIWLKEQPTDTALVIGPNSTVNSIIEKVSLPKNVVGTDTISVAEPKLRDNISWKLDFFS